MNFVLRSLTKAHVLFYSLLVVHGFASNILCFVRWGDRAAGDAQSRFVLVAYIAFFVVQLWLLYKIVNGLYKANGGDIRYLRGFALLAAVHFYSALVSAILANTGWSNFKEYEQFNRGYLERPVGLLLARNDAILLVLTGCTLALAVKKDTRPTSG